MEYTGFMIAEEGLISKLREKHNLKKANKAAAKDFLQHPDKVVTACIKSGKKYGVELVNTPEAKKIIQDMCDLYNKNPGKLKKYKNHSVVKDVSGIPVVIARYDHDDSICQIVIPVKTADGKINCDIITAGQCATLMND